MKLIDMSRQDIAQFYILPAIIIASLRTRTKVFLVWLNWCIEI